MHYFSETMKTWGITTVTTVLVFILIGSWLPGDTHVPLRGLGTVAKGTFTIPGHTNTFAYRRSIPDHAQFPPPLPEVTYGAYGQPRFKQLLPDTYLIIVGTNDTILTTNKPSITRRKGFWEIQLD